MWTHNKGTEEERLADAISAFKSISAWRQKEAIDSILTRKLKDDTIVMNHIRMTIGGDDLYGHVVWLEQLNDIATLCDCGLSAEEIKMIRAQGTEAVEAVKRNVAKSLGVRRYKQIYVLDLAPVSFGSLITRADVRNLTKEIMGVGSDYYPEGMWKIFIVNAPFIFRSVYAIISPFINVVTREKIKILGGPRGFLPEFAKAGIDKRSIPTSIGGAHVGVDVLALIRAQQEAASAARAGLDSSASALRVLAGAGVTSAPAGDASPPPPRVRRARKGGWACCGSADAVADQGPPPRRPSRDGDARAGRSPSLQRSGAPEAEPRSLLAPAGGSAKYEAPSIVPVEVRRPSGRP
ncbi:CRAL-TRIO domain-containing protein [Pelagophyceae sp. CCMP2097]|nr:CRAL-TRIO domain-containing protein [Pelagophyceae sp. CCMP2097]